MGVPVLALLDDAVIGYGKICGACFVLAVTVNTVKMVMYIVIVVAEDKPGAAVGKDRIFSQLFLHTFIKSG